MRCDLCAGTTELNWTYVTRPDPDVRFEDEEWLVCSPCDVIIQSGDLEALIARGIATQPLLISNDQEFVDKIMANFPDHVRQVHTHFMRTWDARHPEPGFKMEAP